MNINELILEKVRTMTFHDLGTKEMLLRLTSLEEPSLQCTAEGEELVDALGSLITTLYKAKKATFSGTNSLLSLDLAGQQFGSKKEVATSEKKIVDFIYDILEVKEEGGKVQLSHKPVKHTEVKFIYELKNGEIGRTFKAGSIANATDFVISKDGQITAPTGFTGKIFVEYEFENENAVKISNRASNFPQAGSLVLYCYFKDKCNENIRYSGKVICPKAKLNPESIELALNSTGKHPFEFTMSKDYCAEEGEDELFSIIVSKE